MCMVDLGYWAHQVSVGTEDVSSAPDSSQSYHPMTSSSWLPSVPPHILPHSSHSLYVSFPPPAVSPSCFVAHILFCLFLLLLSSFLHFLFFAPLSFILGFLISCVLTTSPHLPSSDPSGPETPSFSAYRALSPPKVLTPQHTALCAAVHNLSLQRGLIDKACLYTLVVS